MGTRSRVASSGLERASIAIFIERPGTRRQALYPMILKIEPRPTSLTKGVSGIINGRQKESVLRKEMEGAALAPATFLKGTMVEALIHECGGTSGVFSVANGT